MSNELDDVYFLVDDGTYLWASTKLSNSLLYLCKSVSCDNVMYGAILWALHRKFVLPNELFRPKGIAAPCSLKTFLTFLAKRKSNKSSVLINFPDGTEKILIQVKRTEND